MERSLHEDKDLNSKEQSLEEITLAIRTKLDTNVNLSEDKISELEHLVKEYRKAKSFSKHRQNLRRVPPPIISEEWLELDKESIFNNPLMRNLQLGNHDIRSSQLKLCLLSSAIFPELGFQQEDNSVVFCDNQSAIYLIRNQAYHERTKHIDVRYHSIREAVAERNMTVKKIGTADNPTDLLTKPVPANKFKHCLNLIGMLG